MFQINNLNPNQLKGLSVNGKGQVVLNGKNTSIDASLFSEELLAMLTQNQGKESLGGFNLNEELPKQNLDILPKNLNSIDQVSPTIIDSDLTKEVSEILNKQTNLVQPDLQKNSVLLEDINNNPELSKILNSENLNEDQLFFSNPKNLETKSANPFKNELSTQLATGEDFINQKSILKNKIAHKNPYYTKAEGLKVDAEVLSGPSKVLPNEMKKLATENIETKLIIPTTLVVGENTNFKTNVDVSSGQNIKTMQFADLKTGDANQIMNQITDYIIQAKASKEETVSLKINHQDLGILDITVQKLPGINQDSMALNIGTQTLEGKVFFQENSKDLLAHLNQAGLNVLDVKVDQGSFEKKNEFDLTGQGRNQNFQNKEFSSEQNQRRHDQNRRQELWDLFKDKEAA